MKTLQFEAVKIAMKQDRSGVVLTLNIHPDDLPVELMRDFVGARYQVVMVRLNSEEKPMNRDAEYSRDAVRAAGILCRDKQFAEYLLTVGHTLDAKESTVVEWLRTELDIQSRTELKENHKAAKKLAAIEQEFQAWKLSA